MPFKFGGGNVTLCQKGFAQILGIAERTLSRYKEKIAKGEGLRVRGRQAGTQCGTGTSVRAWMERRMLSLDKMPNKTDKKGRPVVSRFLIRAAASREMVIK